MGYTKLQLQANKMEILANCFETANGSIQDMVAGGNVSLEGTDWIKLYDPQTYSYVDASWYGEGYGVYENAEASDPCADQGWGDVYQNIVTYPLEVGQAFWANAADQSYICVAGSVDLSGEIVIPQNKMVLVGNPFYTDTDIQTVEATGNFSLEGTDWIRVYNPETFSYIDVSWYGEGYGVYENAEASEPCADKGWGDVYQNIVELTVPAGRGFWCSSVEGGKLCFKNPLVKE